MRILVVSTHDSRGGAGKAAYRFSKEFINQGNEVCLYVRDKKEKDSFITTSKTPRFITKLFHTLDFGPGYVFSGFDKNIPFTLGVFGESLESIINEFKPDIINVHWTWKGFISFFEICRVSKKIPVVWTMHDYSPFSDGIFYPTERMNKCLRILKKINQLARKVSLRNANITFVSPSEFLLNEFNLSYLAQNHRGESINNGVDKNLFNDKKRKLAKEKLGLKSNKKYIGFGAVNLTSNYIKGGDILKKVLEDSSKFLLKENIGLLGFGSQNPFEFIKLDKKIDKHFVGFIQEDRDMAEFLSACDLFLVPSRFENYPFVVMESLCVGTPVIAFNIGGIPEMIKTEVNGVLVSPYNIKQFISSLNMVIKSDVKMNSTDFDIKDKAAEYIKIFENCLINV